MKSFGNQPPASGADARDNEGKSVRSAEYTLAGALIGVCVIGGGAAWWLTRDSGESVPKPAAVAIAAPSATTATKAMAAAAKNGANWPDQPQPENGKNEPERPEERLVGKGGGGTGRTRGW